MSYSDTTLDRRRLPSMSSRQDLSSSSSTSKDFRPGSSRFRLSRNILSLSDVVDCDAPGSGGSSPLRRNHHHHHHHLPPVSGRQLNSPRLSKRFSSAASSTQSAAVATGSTSTSSSSSQSNSRSSAMGGLMAGAATSNTEPPISFCPPDASWQKSKARLLGLTVQQSHWYAPATTTTSTAAAAPRNCRHTFPSDTPPKTCEAVAGDGNCLFRALSFWITGSEDFHIEVRDVIVQEINSNARLYSAVTSNHSITNYLRESQMSEEGVWGSEVEIFVAATLLQTPIAVYAAFGDRHLWQVFRPLQYTEPRERCMLYLQNSNNHFEPVIDV